MKWLKRLLKGLAALIFLLLLAGVGFREWCVWRLPGMRKEVNDAWRDYAGVALDAVLKRFMLACVVIAVGISFSCDYLPGTIDAGEYGETGLSDQKGDLVHMYGSRRKSLSKLEDVALFYGLIVDSQRQCYVHSESSALDHAIGSFTFGYSKLPISALPIAESELTHLRVEIFNRKHIIRIQENEFDWRKGNLFVIRLDDACQPHSEQLAKRIESPTENTNVLEMFKRSYPDDAQIQKLSLE